MRWRSSGEAASPADGADPRIEAYLTASSAPSETAATRQTEGIFDRYSTGHVRVNAEIIPVTGKVPYTNFGVGDSIAIPNRSLVNVATQILAMVVAELSPEQDGVVGGTQTFTLEGLQ